MKIEQNHFTGRLTDFAHEHWDQFLQPGMTALDATAGNGFDTLFLAEKLGEEGQLFVIDIQTEAISSAKAHVNSAGFPKPKMLWAIANHNEIISLFPKLEALDFACYNLGYLPQSDHGVVTHIDDTLDSLRQTLSILKENGMLSIIAYRAHEGGLVEYEGILDYFKNLPEGTLKVWETGNEEKLGPVMMLYRKS